VKKDVALAVVTGAGSGIGRAVARRLASDGWAVLAADVDLEAARGTADGQRNIQPFHVDVSREESVQELVAIAADTGPILGLVNAAGIGSTTNAPDTPQELWERVMAVNACGTFLCCKHVIPICERGSQARS
jgi:NAD(P)-dependent dehydrogenase (short-subunit alcohol dehydrogenase family)